MRPFLARPISYVAKLATFHKLWTPSRIICNSHEIEKIDELPFLDTLASRTDEDFLTSVCSKKSTVSLCPHASSCNPPSQKMDAFCTFVNRVLNISSNTISFNNEIQCIKAIDLDSGYNDSIVNVNLELQNNRVSHLSHYNSNLNIAIPYSPKSSFSIVLK